MIAGLQIAVFVTGFAMSMAPLFQVAAIYRARSSANVSMTWPVIIFAGCIVWLLNGVYLDATAIIASEVLGIITNGLTIGTILLFRDGPQGWLRRDRELSVRSALGEGQASMAGKAEPLAPMIENAEVGE